MKKITPYTSYRYALASLDNGGRFYHFASKSRDGDISSAELAKAAGVFSGNQRMILYLEMSLCGLKAEAKKEVLNHLSDDLKTAYLKHRPADFSPAEARQQAVVSQTAMITGIPRLIDAKAEFAGFVMIPIISGTTTTFTLVPIIDQYDVYELREVESDQEVFIAHSRSKRKLPERLTRCGGVIKELKGQKKQSTISVFLEMMYYTHLTQ